MKVVFVFVLLIAVTLANPEFDSWMSAHGKKYSSGAEYLRRLDIYKSNQAFIEHLNKIDTAEYRMNQFGDLSPAEFKAQYLSPIPMDLDGVERREVELTGTAPASFDWRSQGAVLPVKNQAQCGSCWTFSAIATCETAWFLAGNPLTGFSEQAIVDCCHLCDPQDKSVCCAGCEGGLMFLALEWLVDNGLTTEEAYQYFARDDKCTFDKSQAKAHIKSYDALPKDEDKMAEVLSSEGVLSIGVNAEWMQFYFGGISHPLFCSPKKLDHGVALVGYSKEGDKPYWILRNSWGESWGEKGYMKIYRGKNVCGVAEAVTIAHA